MVLLRISVWIAIHNAYSQLRIDDHQGYILASNTASHKIFSLLQYIPALSTINPGFERLLVCR